MSSVRKRRTAARSSLRRRAEGLTRPIAAALGVAASAVTVAAFLGLGGGSPGATGSVLSDAGGDASGASVAITAIGAGRARGEYTLEGTAVGVTDPPWQLYVLARPKAPPAQAEIWAVSGPVVPSADGRWSASVAGPDLEPPVVFEPVLLKSRTPVASPWPTGMETGLPSGGSPPSPSADVAGCMLTPRGVELCGDEILLARDGPQAEIVAQRFSPTEFDPPG